MEDFSSDLGVVIPYFFEGTVAGDAIADAAIQERLKRIVFVSDCGVADSDFDELCVHWKAELGDQFLPICCIRNSGPSFCRNLALGALEDCRYLGFLDSDDRWSINHSKTTFEYFKSNTSCTVVAKQKFSFFLRSGLRRIGFWELCCWNPVVLSSVIVDCKRLVTEGNHLIFPEGQDYGEDYLVWIKISLLFDIYVDFGSRDVERNRSLNDRQQLSANTWKVFLGCLRNAREIRTTNLGLGSFLLSLSAFLRLIFKLLRQSVKK